MKFRNFFLSWILCSVLLAGCGTPGADAPPPEHSSDPVMTSDTPSPAFITCRIVDGAESGRLVLAEHGDTGAGVYTLSLESSALASRLTEPLRNGQLINIYYDTFTEAWPMEFGGVSAIKIADSGFDNRAALYLQVLEDLWNAYPALCAGVEIIGMDLTQTSLSPAEQAAVGWVFAGNHGAEPVDGTLHELIEQGWITATPLSISGSGLDVRDPRPFFYEWENGCHFSITEQPMEGSFSLVPVTFDAMKWRSSLGACGFCGCTSVQTALGEWSGYQIGSQVVS